MPDEDAGVIRIKVEPKPVRPSWVNAPAADEAVTTARRAAAAPSDRQAPVSESTSTEPKVATLELSGPTPAAEGDTIVIEVSDQDVRLCPNPECLPESDILWLSASQETTVMDISTVATGGAAVWDLVWYRVELDSGSIGWVSEYDTDHAPAGPRFR